MAQAGRTTPDTPVSKRLDTNERSNIFIYMTGHGGDEFLKFQDNEEISAFDIADAFQQMHTQKRWVVLVLEQLSRLSSRGITLPADTRRSSL